MTETNGFPRTAFLLGAGVSVAAGQYSTKDITDKILSEKGINEAEIIRSLNNPPETQILKFAPSIRKFIFRLKCVADENNTKTFWKSDNREHRKVINYEDIYFMLNVIDERLSGNFKPYGNMLIKETHFDDLLDIFQEEVRSNARYHLIRDETVDETYFVKLTSKYILHTVYKMLLEKNELGDDRLENLKFLSDAFSDTGIGDIDIFTLNHDTIIDQVLKRAKVDYADGLGKEDQGSRKWNPEKYLDKPSTKDRTVRLLKIHGSIELRDGSDDEWVFRVGHLFLIGTDNKAERYFQGYYIDTIFRFRQYLKSAERLVICGYSFGDKTINDIIFSWIREKESRKCIVIDKTDNDEFYNSLDHPYKNYWQDARVLYKQLIYEPKSLEKAEWSDIKSKYIEAP